MLDCLLLDLDGTLLDTRELIVASFQHTFRTCLGREVTAEEIYPYFGEPLRVTMLRFAPERVDELLAVYRSFNQEQHDRLARPFPGAVETVRALRARGMAMAVVSSKIRRSVLRGLDLLGLREDLPVVVALEDAPAAKPDPAPILRALDLLGHPPRGSLMVGDSPADLESARRAGVLCAAVGWSVLPRETLAAARPDYWLESWTALPALCAVPA